MYVVKVPFKYQEEDGRIVEVGPGDFLPGFENWNYSCQKAHIDLGWVVKQIPIVVKASDDLSKKIALTSIEENQKKGRSSKK